MFINLSDLLKIDQTLDKYMKLAAALLAFSLLSSFVYAQDEQPKQNSSVIKVTQTFSAWKDCNGSPTPEWGTCDVTFNDNNKTDTIKESEKYIFIPKSGEIARSNGDKVFLLDGNPLSLKVKMRANNMDDYSSEYTIKIDDFEKYGYGNRLRSCGFLGFSSKGFRTSTSVIFDSYVDIERTDNNEALVIETDYLKLTLSEFYENGNNCELQYSCDNGENWNSVAKQPKIWSKGVIYLKYEDIVGKFSDDNKRYFDLVGKQIQFRIVKTLINNEKTYGKIAEANFYPKGPDYSISDIRNTSCGIHVYVDIELSQYLSKLLKGSSEYEYKGVVSEGDGTESSGISGEVCLNEIDDKTELLFIDEKKFFEAGRTYTMQLMVYKKGSSSPESYNYKELQFQIPSQSPKQIKISQTGKLFEYNGTSYHLYNKNNPYVVLKIEDNDDLNNGRLPYVVYDVETGKELQTIEQKVLQFDDLSDDQKKNVENNVSVKSKDDYIKSKAEDWYNSHKSDYRLKLIRDDGQSSSCGEKLGDIQYPVLLVKGMGNKTYIYYMSYSSNSCTPYTFYVKGNWSCGISNYSNQGYQWKYVHSNDIVRWLDMTDDRLGITEYPVSNTDSPKYVMYKEFKDDYGDYICGNSQMILSKKENKIYGSSFNEHKVYQEITVRGYSNGINITDDIAINSDNDIIVLSKDKRNVIFFKYDNDLKWDYNESYTLEAAAASVNDVRINNDNTISFKAISDNKWYKQLSSEPTKEDFIKYFNDNKAYIGKDSFDAMYDNYKQYMVNAYILANYGYKIYGITPNKEGKLYLVDSDGCQSDTLSYKVNVRDGINVETTSQNNPSATESKDGEATVIVVPGGSINYYYDNELISNEKQITLNNLVWGKNPICFTDKDGVIIYTHDVILSPNVNANVIHQTCSVPNGKIEISGNDKNKCSNVICYSPVNESIEYNINALSKGIYNVKCLYGNDYWVQFENLEVKGDAIFDYTVKVSDADEIGKEGTVEIDAKNFGDNIKWGGDVNWTDMQTAKSTYKLNSGHYTVKATSQTGCVESRSFEIKSPNIDIVDAEITEDVDLKTINFKIPYIKNELVNDLEVRVNGKAINNPYTYDSSAAEYKLSIHYNVVGKGEYKDLDLCAISPTFETFKPTAKTDENNSSRCFGIDGKIIIDNNNSSSCEYSLDDGRNYHSVNSEQCVNVHLSGIYKVKFRKQEEIKPNKVEGKIKRNVLKTIDNIEVVDVEKVLFVPGITHVSCRDKNDGSVQIASVINNVGDCSFVLKNEHGDNVYSGSNLANGLAPGHYTMIVYDQVCELNISDAMGIDIESPEEALDITNVCVKDPICADGSNGEINAEIVGGWKSDENKYSVKLDDKVKNLNLDNSEFSFDCLSAKDENYILYISDGKCEITKEIKLKKYTNPSVKSAYSDPVSCYGLDDGKIKDIKIETNGELNGNDVYAKSLLYYSFFEPKNSNFYDAKEEIGLEGTISEIDNLAAGTYNLRVVDNNDCVTETGSELTIYVHQPDPLDVMVKEDKIEITERDGNDGAISVQVSGGNIGLDEITLTTEDGDEQRVLTSNTNVLQPVKGLKAGKYVVTVKDKKRCEMPEEKEPVVVELKQPDSKLSADVSSTDGLCAAMIGSITVHPTGGWGDYMITVSGEGVERVANENSEDAVFDGLKAGTYQVDVVDRNGARRRYEQVVESPEPISHKLIKSPVTCDDNGSVKIEITGGRGSYKSQMEGDEIVHDGDDVVYSDLKSHKEYVLLTTDENECEAKLTFTLDDDAMEIDIDDEYFQNENEGKYGVKMHASVNGGVAPYTYSWSQIGNVPSEVFSTDAEAVIYRSGIYELTVKDALCTKSVVHDVAIGYDQKMIVEELHNQTSTTANGRVVLISDQTDFTSLTVFCGTEKMDIGDLQWSDKRLTIDNLSGGSYSVEGVLQDGTRRMATFYIEPYIEMQKEYVHVKNVSRAGADDGSIEVKFWGGIAPYGVSISNKADDYHDSVDTEENHVKFDNLSPAEYLITVTDGGNNIFGFETIYVNAPEIPLTLTCVENSPTKCYGDSNAEIKLKATGGWSHYRYADSKDMEYVGNMVFGGLPASNRRFYVIDEYGVKDSVDVIVTQPDELRATIASIDSLRCYMDPDGGAITFDITGGNGDYRIKYLSEDRDMHLGNKLEGLPSDDYKVTFTDRNQCTSPDMIEFHIPQPDMLEIANLDIVNTTCELDNGKIDIEMKGGSLPYRYDWKENGKSYTNNKNIGLTHTKAEGLLQRGLYAIEISDSHECRTKTDDIRIVESHNPRIAQDGVHTTDALCNGSSDGIAYVDSSDVIMGFPASPFKLTWPQGQDNVMGVSTLPAGQYEVIISDENNCSTSSQFTIGEPAAIVNRLVGLRNAWCYGYSDGRIETATTGGIGAYKYLWNTGEETTYLDSIKAGVYTVVVTDEHECTDTAKYEVGEPEKLIVDLGDDVLICPGNVYVFDGGEYTTYSWTKAETGDEKESGRYFATGEEGVYALQVTNDIGCFARDTVRLSIGNDALIANFLMASDAAVNDTILLVELSNMPVDSIRWEYDVDSFKSLTFDDDESYQFNLSAENTGRFYVTMWAYSGGCESFEQKYIDIFEACEDSSDFKIGYDPLIKSAKISPNPNDGEFDLMIKLREESDVDVTIHDVHDGKQIEHVVLNGMDTYNTRLNIRQWGSGIFVLKITAGNEGRVIKVLTTR